MTVFGSRDFDGPRGAAAASPLPPEGGTAVPGYALAADRRRVLLRVHGGEDIVVGLAGDREQGVRLAQRVMRLVEDAEARGRWPELDDRFVRPGAIVSIDVQAIAPEIASA